MKVVSAAIFTFLILAGCTTTGPSDPDSKLRSEYDSFIYALESKSTSKALQHLSQRHTIKLDVDPQWDDFENTLPIISVLDRMLPTTRSSFEVIQHNTACLTVNGDDPGNEPTSFNIAFVQENSVWKMDYVQVVYHESRDDLPTAAACPTRLP